MNREKEILLELLLEKYGTNNAVQPKPKEYIANGKHRRRGRNVPTVYSNSRWTIQDIGLVYDKIVEGLGDHEIAKLVGRSFKSIRTLRGMLVGNSTAKSPVVCQFLANKQNQPK